MKYKPQTREELQKLVQDENIYLGDIDTSLITDMSNLFYESSRKDFEGIECWDVSNVENMSYMFWECVNFNQPICFGSVLILISLLINGIFLMLTMFRLCLEIVRYLIKI